ncbi:unnamed protein product [Clavelina lepadiformis]|uniref:Uncharacterized protein n=1 Tax=Clavelina lepadiformis TaxID=159417 RepID=A0ABP0GI67_CLALP
MDYENDDELLDWNLDIDGDFEGALNDEDQGQNLNHVSKRRQQAPAKTPASWVTFSPEIDNPPSPSLMGKRWSGDGVSITSQDGENFKTSQKISTTQDGTENDGNNSYGDDTGSSFSKSMQDKPNSFADYLPKYTDDGQTRFTILDEDDADITGYDASPMEFRGNLKTGNPPYRSESSSCCVIFRYMILMLLGFALGILVGYFIAFNRQVHVSVVNPSPASSTYPTRALLDTTSLYNNTLGDDLTAMNASSATTTSTSEPPGKNLFVML